MARVLLIRHCQSAWAGPGIEPELSEEGHRQAQYLATWLADRGIDRVVSSPYQRAIDTVLPFAKTAGLEVEIDERLGERVLGGGTFATEAERWEAVRLAMVDRQLRHEGGETGLEVTARGWPAILGALDGANAVTVLVSHGQMSSHLLREIDGTSGYDLWRAMTTPDVFEIWRDDIGALHARRIWEQP